MGLEGAQAVADDLALGGIFAGLDLGSDHFGHFMSEGDAELLGCAHEVASCLDRILSYYILSHLNFICQKKREKMGRPAA